MDKRRWLALGVLVLGASAVVATSAGASAESAGSVGRPSATEFWTHARVARAVPRDFVYDRTTGRFEAAKGRPGGGGGTTTTTVTGASWTLGGDVADTTGKVLFALGTSYYVCSANLVVDTKTDRSIVVTAGHCTYDETTGVPATNWVYIPNYDAAPAPLSSSSRSYCADTKFGCWEATALVTATGFATAGGFNDQATVHDYAFAVLKNGGKGNSLVEQALAPDSTPQAIAFTNYPAAADAWLFGYPASGKYKGNDLVHCRGPIGFDSRVGNATYRVGCNMTGGSSGGPWHVSFDSATGRGTQMSVNSYGYSGETAMFGPIFNTETKAMYDLAQSTSASGSVLYP